MRKDFTVERCRSEKPVLGQITCLWPLACSIWVCVMSSMFKYDQSTQRRIHFGFVSTGKLLKEQKTKAAKSEALLMLRRALDVRTTSLGESSTRIH